MHRIKHLILLFLSISMVSLSSAQQREDYRLGTLWLKNAQPLEGYIWTAAGLTDRLDFVFYKPELNDLPDKYYADDFAQFELWQGSRRFYSVVLPIGNTKVRKIAELHFKGEYSLYSTFVGEEIIYFIADKSGSFTRLDSNPGNTNGGGVSSENSSQGYREKLSSMLSDMPGVAKKTDNLKYSRKDLSGLMTEYHTGKKLQYTSYPIPKADFHLNAGFGTSMIWNTSKITVEPERFVSPVSYINIAGEIAAHTGISFVRIGMVRYSGMLHRDFSRLSGTNLAVIFYEERNNITMTGFSILGGVDFFETGRFSFYVAAGIEYMGYRKYVNQVMKETLFYEDNRIVADWNQYTTLPWNVSALVAEAGTDFTVNNKTKLRAGISYGTMIDKAGILNNKINLAVTCVYKLFQ